MSAAEISSKPQNTTSNPYASLDKPIHTSETAKRSSDSVSDSQYWRYDVSQKRPRHGDGDRLCFKFISSGSCTRGEQCHFRHDADAREQSLRGVCFDFMNKGKCERGPDCTFKHSLQEVENGSSRRHGPGKGNTDRFVFWNYFFIPLFTLAKPLPTSHGRDMKWPDLSITWHWVGNECTLGYRL